MAVDSRHMTAMFQLDLSRLQDAFTSLIKLADPQHIPSFFIWLDLKVSQFKITGIFIPGRPDTSPESVKADHAKRTLFKESEDAVLVSPRINSPSRSNTYSQSSSSKRSKLNESPFDLSTEINISRVRSIRPTTPAQSSTNGTNNLTCESSGSSPKEQSPRGADSSGGMDNFNAQLQTSHSRLAMDLSATKYPLNIPYLSIINGGSNAEGAQGFSSFMGSSLNNAEPIDFSVSESREGTTGKPHPSCRESILRSSLAKTLSSSRKIATLLKIPRSRLILPATLHNSVVSFDQGRQVERKCGQGEEEEDGSERGREVVSDELPVSRSSACPYCSKTFRYRSSYRRHVKIHQGIFSHECFVCMRKFTRKEHYVRHKCNRRPNKLNRSSASGSPASPAEDHLSSCQDESISSAVTAALTIYQQRLTANRGSAEPNSTRMLISDYESRYSPSPMYESPAVSFCENFTPSKAEEMREGKMLENGVIRKVDELYRMPLGSAKLKSADNTDAVDDHIKVEIVDHSDDIEEKKNEICPGTAALSSAHESRRKSSKPRKCITAEEIDDERVPANSGDMLTNSLVMPDADAQCIDYENGVQDMTIKCEEGVESEAAWTYAEKRPFLLRLLNRAPSYEALDSTSCNLSVHTVSSSSSSSSSAVVTTTTHDEYNDADNMTSGHKQASSWMRRCNNLLASSCLRPKADSFPNNYHSGLNSNAHDTAAASSTGPDNQRPSLQASAGFLALHTGDYRVSGDVTSAHFESDGGSGNDAAVSTSVRIRKQGKYLKLHRDASVSEDGTLTFVCPHCSKKFHRSSNFSRHMRIHRGIYSYVCGTCARGFFRREHYTKHKCDRRGSLAGAGSVPSPGDVWCAGGKVAAGWSQSPIDTYLPKLASNLSPLPICVDSFVVD